MKQYIIIEDEKPAARRLQRMLQKEGIEVSILLHSVEDAVAWLYNNPNPDLIFADIHLSDGTCFHIFEQITVTSKIIFTTAFDQYAIKAFKLNSIDYLLKPIKKEELHFAISKYRNQEKKSPDLKEFLTNFSTKKYYKERFTITYGQHLQSIPVSEISCFYSQNKATFLVTNDGKEFLYDQSLEYIEKQINPKDFMRINRKYIICYSAIQDVLTYSNSRFKIQMKNFSTTDIIVARERVKNFKEWLSK